MKKILVLLALITAFSFTAHAEEIDSVSIILDGEAPEAGDEIELDFEVYAGGSGYYVTDYNYTLEEGTWNSGQKPQIWIELQASGGYEFRKKDKSYFEIEGMNAKFSRATGDLKDDPSYLMVYVTLAAIPKKTTFELDPPDDFYWEDYTAVWEKVDDATSYDVRLSCDGKTVTTVTTSELDYSFAKSMTKDGFYSFKLRAVHGTKKGEWSYDSNDLYVKPGEVYESTKSQSSGPQSSGGQSGQVGAFSSYWKQGADGVWHIYDRSGNLVTNCWLCDDAVAANGQSVWYLIDGGGNMISSGLVRDASGNYYSLETEHNGHFGMMRYQSGTYGNVRLELEPSHNGRYGAINNQDAISALSASYGVTDISAISARLVYTSKF